MITNSTRKVIDAGVRLAQAKVPSFNHALFYFGDNGLEELPWAYYEYVRSDKLMQRMDYKTQPGEIELKKLFKSILCDYTHVLIYHLNDWDFDDIEEILEQFEIMELDDTTDEQAYASMKIVCDAIMPLHDIMKEKNLGKKIR